MAADDKPQLTILPLTDEEKTFGHAQDALNRGGFGSRLTQLILNNASNELTIAIDAPWGEGKTVFVEMWQKSLKKAGIYSIYYDAFASDFHDQPLLPFFAEVNNLLPPSTFIEKGMQQAGGMVSPVIRDVMNFVAGHTAPNTVDAIFKALEKNENQENKIDELRGLLTKAPQNLKEPYRNKPIVFIIDELDRCKPSHAVKMLEIVKHLFRVPNIVFVLSINSTQLQESIKHEYGANIDAYNYLHKFIDYSFALPKSNNNYENSDINLYVRHCINKLDIIGKNDAQKLDSFGVDLATHLLIHFQFSLRQIEKYLSNVRLAFLMMDQGSYDKQRELIILLCALKIKAPEVYHKLTDANTSYQEIIDIIDNPRAIRNSDARHLAVIDDLLKINLNGQLCTLRRIDPIAANDYKCMKSVMELLDSMQ